MKTAREYDRWLSARLGPCAALAVVAACSAPSAPPEIEVPECRLSADTLAQEVGLDPGKATVREIHARLADRSAGSESAADRRTLRLVEEVYFRELGLAPERWFSSLALADPGCGASAPPPVRTASCRADIAALEVSVAGCQRLLSPHVPADGMDDLFEECIQKLRSTYPPAAGTDCAAAARAAASQVAAAVMAKANTAGRDLARLPGPRTAARPAHGSPGITPLLDEEDPRFADIRRRLGIVNDWLAFALDLGFPIDDLPGALSAIWRDAYAVPPPQPPATQPSPGDVLAFLDRMDQFLALDGLQAADYVPLMRLNIEAMALARIANEIETRYDLVQILCNLGDCNTNVAVADIAQAMVALREDDVPLPVGTALGDRAEAWLDVLAAAHQNRDRLKAALASVPDDAHAQLLGAWIDRVRLPLQKFQAGPSERLPLATRLHDENRNAIRVGFTAAKSELNESLDRYKQARLQYAASQIAALGRRESELGLGNELIRATEVLADAETKMAALRRLHDDAERRWAAAGDFVSRMKSLGLEGEVILSPGDSIPVPLPASASFTPDDGAATPANIAAKAVHSWTVAQGDTLRFTVRNKWSPTCSLRSAGLHDNALLQNIDTTYADTGPEGYYLQYSNSNFSAQSSNQANGDVTAAGVCRATVGAVTAVVAAAGAAAAPPPGGTEAADGSPPLLALSFWDSVGDFFGDVGGLLGDCVEGILGGGSSGGSSSSEGDESRRTAAFAEGIRLANTPFPKLPAGSLVLVLVSDDRFADTNVVHASAAIQMPSAGTAYLVVNDIGCVDSSGTLTVDWAQGQNTGPRAIQLAQAMAQIAADAQPLVDDIAEVGLFTSADADDFRNGARQALRESCGNCNIDAAFPPAVLGMFDEWIAHQTAQIQRRVDLRRLAFDTRLHAITIDSLAGQLALEQEGGRWTEYVKQLAFTELSDTSLKRLENAVDAASEFLEQRIDPILRVRYPEVLARVSQIAVESVADLDLSIDALATDLNEFVIRLDAELAQATTGAKGENTTPVLLWIPKPGAPRTFNGGNVRVLVASDDDIRNVWRSAANGTFQLADDAHFRVVLPELYTPDAGVADRLACGRTAPIISGLLLYGVDENSPFVGQPFNDPMNINRFSVSADLASPVFVTDNGVQAYDLVAGNAGELRVARGTFNDRTAVANAFVPQETSLRGLSPFLDVQLSNAASLDDKLTNVSGLALIMHVSSYTADSGISHCD